MLHITYLCHWLHSCRHWLVVALVIALQGSSVTSLLRLSVRLHLRSSGVSHLARSIDVETVCHNGIMKGHTTFLNGSVSLNSAFPVAPAVHTGSPVFVFLLDDGLNRPSGSGPGGSPSVKRFPPPLPHQTSAHMHPQTQAPPSCFLTVTSDITARLSTCFPKTSLTVKGSSLYPRA